MAGEHGWDEELLALGSAAADPCCCCWSPSNSLNMAATKDRLLSPIHLLTGLPCTDEGEEEGGGAPA